MDRRRHSAAIATAIAGVLVVASVSRPRCPRSRGGRAFRLEGVDHNLPSPPRAISHGWAFGEGRSYSARSVPDVSMTSIRFARRSVNPLERSRPASRRTRRATSGSPRRSATSSAGSGPARRTRAASRRSRPCPGTSRSDRTMRCGSPSWPAATSAASAPRERSRSSRCRLSKGSQASPPGRTESSGSPRTTSLRLER